MRDFTLRRAELEKDDMLLSDKLFLCFDMGNKAVKLSERWNKTKNCYERQYQWTLFVRLRSIIDVSKNTVYSTEDLNKYNFRFTGKLIDKVVYDIPGT